ncbi:PilZ domain-containing protein [Desulfopila sp. IMCC35006]|uniref:PilZ domain-containing protein n=1 Tax=Desulfopila sp. IMCC35006 TaxID=2569542 RepID=UPI0010AD93DE|nr:PilZ domain-containing protein [Desulfopila sp. IMCC35006]TKB26474.1 PilZ domain-containing protein [Desulfopila sp. IMCC35006]
MTTEDSKPKEKCPFWSAASVKCTICDDGLFIPLDNHAEAFCKTSRYAACMQYTLYSENHIYLQEKVRKSEVNRRKYLRIETSYAITLVKIIASGDTVASIPYEAQTIDVSKSGMRVATSQPLVHEALVQFSFDASFPLRIHNITGQVEWCNKQIDEPGYQAGVSFRGKQPINALLGMPERHHSR